MTDRISCTFILNAIGPHFGIPKQIMKVLTICLIAFLVFAPAHPAYIKKRSVREAIKVVYNELKAAENVPITLALTGTPVASPVDPPSPAAVLSATPTVPASSVSPINSSPPRPLVQLLQNLQHQIQVDIVNRPSAIQTIQNALNRPILSILWPNQSNVGHDPVNHDKIDENIRPTLRDQ